VDDVGTQADWTAIAMAAHDNSYYSISANHSNAIHHSNAVPLILQQLTCCRVYGTDEADDGREDDGEGVTDGLLLAGRSSNTDSGVRILNVRRR